MINLSMQYKFEDKSYFSFWIMRNQFINHGYIIFRIRTEAWRELFRPRILEVSGTWVSWIYWYENNPWLARTNSGLKLLFIQLELRMFYFNWLISGFFLMSTYKSSIEKCCKSANKKGFLSQVQYCKGYINEVDLGL